MPEKDTPSFSVSGVLSVSRRAPAEAASDRSAEIIATLSPSSRISGASPNATNDTRTAAPSFTQASSLHASKMRVCFTMASSTSRFLPPRIELVDTRPARFSRPSAITRRACSNQ